MIAQDTFREIFDQAPVGMAYVSLDGKWLEVNPRLCEIIGYSREELLATTWQKITHPDDLGDSVDVAARVASGDLVSHTFEKRYIHKDGRTIWVKKHVSVMRNGEHSEPYYITIVDDITDRKRAEELRRKAEEKYSVAFHQSPAAMVLFSFKDQRFVEVNDAFELFSGYTRQEAIGRTSNELNLFVDPAAPQEMLEAVLAGKIVKAWERLFRTKDGKIGSALFFADQIEIDGELFIVGTALDITDRKRAEELRRKAEEKWSIAFRQSPAAIVINRLEDGRYLEVNEAFERYSGFSRDEMIGRTPFELNVWVEPARRQEIIDAVRAGGSVQHWEVSFRRKDGSVNTGLTFVDKIEVDGEPCLIWAVLDITDRKHAEELRRKAEEKWSIAFRQSPTAIMLISLRDRRFVEVNEAFERLTGYARDEIIGKTALDLNLFVDPDIRQVIANTLLSGRRVDGWEVRYRVKDGRILNILSYADQIEIDGEPCLIGLGLDITDRKRLEAELQDLSGRLIEAQDEERRGIATELNDSIGQSITVLSYEACGLARSAQGDLGRKMQSICAKIQHIATGIGIVSQSLHPSGLDFTGLPWALQGLCRQFTHAYGLEVAFKHEHIPPSLPPDVSVCIYRIVQEGLKNVALHSGTKQAWIELVYEEPKLVLKLWDKGPGFDVSSTKSGLGLLTMRERCRRLNASFVIRNSEGTRIEVRIPLENVEAELFPLLPTEEQNAE